ncbi:MAG TPA: glycoside hydrolase family 2 TIM barrel-domain containing protein, partial [Saprospiraceae bacterium]|nr:glycoside hydrolase family 2 TIM barrel-domain containing protein [Saprospiraceae bacterium]
DYGYNSFYVDVTDKLNANGKNIIAVHADTRQHDSRWYPGAGIYRKVQLIAVNPIHVNIWGTKVTTPILKTNYAKVNFITSIANQSAAADSIEIEQVILGPGGNKISSTLLKGNIPANASREFEGTATLTDPDRWDVNHGVLYTLHTIVRKGNNVVDEYSTPFGVRSIRMTADDGFYLNDRRVQLKGVCLHHDQGPLGAAFYPRAMERQLELLKSMGCNAIRTSHNCPAPELLDLCDKMGILVIDEIFDKYDRKADILDTTDFEKFAHRNVHNFVLRDRNHPSIFLWSVGNEIGDVQWNKNGGFEKLRIMVNEFRHYDMSRPLTLVCDSRNSASLRHFDYYDVHSWNYGRRYDLARQLEPNKAVIISESASTVSTRGFYEWPLPQKKTDFTKSLQVSSYDMNAPDWAEIPDDDFMWQQEENYVAGEFVWTGFDYLGEPTPYDNAAVKRMGMIDKEASVSSYFGILDLVGIPKDRFYLYKSYWNKSDTTIHILPHWNWPGMEGKNIPVFVYTSGDCAELFLNGKSLGTKCKIPDSQHSTERFRLMWNDVTYDAGELKAVAYKEGVKIGEVLLATTGKPYTIRLTPDRNTIHADGLDLSYVLIEVVDDHGLVCPTSNLDIQLHVSGVGLIAGVGNGNPQSISPFQSDQIQTFNGKAMLILRSGTQKGTIEVKATSADLQEQKVTITVE